VIMLRAWVRCRVSEAVSKSRRHSADVRRRAGRQSTASTDCIHRRSEPSPHRSATSPRTNCLRPPARRWLSL